MRNSWLCVKINIQKWRVTPRFYVLAAVIAAFGYWSIGGAARIASLYDISASPWMFPHMFSNPLMMSLFGFFALFFYCDAPFLDDMSTFSLVRMGKRDWINGQLLYIVVSALLYTGYWFLCSVIWLLPNLCLTGDWGELITGIADGSVVSLAAEREIVMTFYCDQGIVASFHGLDATMLTLLLVWLVTCFVGILTFCGNLISKKIMGVVAVGFFCFLTLFGTSLFVFMWFGGKYFYISPISWCCLYGLSDGGLYGAPSAVYAVCALITACVIMWEVSRFWFLKNDVTAGGI